MRCYDIIIHIAHNIRVLYQYAFYERKRFQRGIG